MYLKTVYLGKAIEPMIHTKRGPSIRLNFARTESRSKKRPCSIGWYLACDYQLDWSTFLVLDVELDTIRLNDITSDFTGEHTP